MDIETKKTYDTSMKLIWAAFQFVSGYNRPFSKCQLNIQKEQILTIFYDADLQLYHELFIFFFLLLL